MGHHAHESCDNNREKTVISGGGSIKHHNVAGILSGGEHHPVAVVHMKDEVLAGEKLVISYMVVVRECAGLVMVLT